MTTLLLSEFLSCVLEWQEST